MLLNIIALISYHTTRGTMAKRGYFQVRLSRTDNEWAVLEEKIKFFNKKDTTLSYIKRRVRSLIKDFEECPDCITQLVAQRNTVSSVYFDEKEIEGLRHISKMTNTPIATIIDRGIIQTYLIEKA